MSDHTSFLDGKFKILELSASLIESHLCLASTLRYSRIYQFHRTSDYSHYDYDNSKKSGRLFPRYCQKINFHYQYFFQRQPSILAYITSGQQQQYCWQCFIYFANVDKDNQPEIVLLPLIIRPTELDHHTLVLSNASYQGF